MKLSSPVITISINQSFLDKLQSWIEKNAVSLIVFVLTEISAITFAYYYFTGLAVAYNDARSHLDIGRRVVEGLKPGLAQLGSVWLPLPHILMIPTIWSDFMWHSGLSGALISMIAFVFTGVLVYLLLEKLGASLLARFVAVAIFVANMNILYLQSTAMTELLLLATMTAGCYYLMLWAKTDEILNLIKSAFFVMLSTLTRYDGWFLLMLTSLIIAIITYVKKGYKETEGKIILFLTLAAFGITLWFLWNLVIFKDPLYFAFGPFSAHVQQSELAKAGDLQTKGNLLLSAKIYFYSLFYNSYTFPALLGFLGIVAFWLMKIKTEVKIASVALIAPLFFNILALYLGFSVLFVQGISGKTWFNVRYGIMLLPSIAVFVGILLDKLKGIRWTIVGLLAFTLFFAFVNKDAVAIDDARVGSSQKNVSEVSGWLRQNAKDKEGFILISVASHDAIIFSSGLPMKRFIHEGTGAYWESATASPDRWARWIIMRTYDDKDLTWRFVSKTDTLNRYRLVESYPFADIYELDGQFLSQLNTKPIFGDKAEIKNKDGKF